VSDYLNDAGVCYSVILSRGALLKSAWFQRSELEYDKLLSNRAPDFNQRPSSKALFVVVYPLLVGFNAVCRLVSKVTTPRAPFVAQPLTMTAGTEIRAGDGSESANGGAPWGKPSVREHIN
jgi:hypothetical protein